MTATGLYARILTSQDSKGAVYVFDSGREIANFIIPAVYANNPGEIARGALMFGWRFLGTPEITAPGQLLVQVEPRSDA